MAWVGRGRLMRKQMLRLAWVIALGLAPGSLVPGSSLAYGAPLRTAPSTSVPCLPSLLPLPAHAHEARVLAPGVTLRVHEVRQPPTADSAAPRRSFIAVVSVRRDAATVTPVSSAMPLLLHPAEPMRWAGTLASMNGDYFETLRRGDAVPLGALVTGSVPRFVPQGYTDVVAVDSAGVLRKTKVRATGKVTIGGREFGIDAINDPEASADTMVAFTPDWERDVPDGRAAVVVRDSIVVRVDNKDSAPRVPARGFVLLLPSSLSTQEFPRGSEIGVDLGVEALDGREVAAASGHGGAFLVAGRVQPACSPYENSLRPRTMLAWNESGDIWFMTASTRQPDSPGGMRVGGATKTQLAQIARSLGATWAVTMDGGGSTSLYARTGRQARRIDLPTDAWARPVPVLWTVNAPR